MSGERPRGRPFALIIGAGFAGTILARVLRRLGKSVVVVEKARHPRVALGESTTPLANLSLERLAARYRLEDLHHLAAYGRWLEHLPHVRRGLKRGFTFFHHRRGEPYRNGPENAARLMVAASPNSRIADSHWLRADVDYHLVTRAEEEGVDLRQESRVLDVEILPDGVRAQISGPAGPETLEAEVVVDAGGGDGVVARALDLPSRLGHDSLDTSLLWTHMTGLGTLRDAAPEADFEHGPYPEERAAVHHLLDIGWLYVLRFDHGPASVGLVLRNDALPIPAEAIEQRPEQAFTRLLEAYPSLHETFRHAEPILPVRYRRRLQHRLGSAAGQRWFLLPSAYAFTDPMFSTGIAWNLLAIERLASIFEGRYGDAREYALQLSQEADHMESLIGSAYLAMPDFDRFVAVASLYFAAVSYAETRQRLLPSTGARPDAWDGFLGVQDPVIASLLLQTHDRLRRGAGRRGPGLGGGDFAGWLLSRLASRDIMGLDNPARPRLYPVDLRVLEERCDRLGLRPEDVFAALPRLRGEL